MEGVIVLMNYCKRLVGRGDWYLKHTLQRVGTWVHKSPLRPGLALHFQCFLGSCNTTTFFFYVFNTFSLALSVSLEEKGLNKRSSCDLLLKVLLLFVSAIYSID